MGGDRFYPHLYHFFDSFGIFSRDGKSKKYMHYCTISTFSWKIYIWKVKAVSNCNQLILTISHLLNAISPLFGEVFKNIF